MEMLKGFFELDIRTLMIRFNHAVNFMQVFILGQKLDQCNPSSPPFLTSLSAILERALAAYILLLWSGCTALM